MGKKSGRIDKKICFKCKICKSLADFNKGKDAYKKHLWCKSCIREQNELRKNKQDNKKCLICECEFKTVKKTQKFCSSGCYHKSTLGVSYVEKKCAYCGILFTVRRSLDRQKFCSKKCSNYKHTKKIKKECSYCGKIILIKPSSLKKNNFCGKSCHDKYQKGKPHDKYQKGKPNINRRTGRKKYCLYCDNEFWAEPNQEIRGRALYCSIHCSNDAKNVQLWSANPTEANKQKKLYHTYRISPQEYIELGNSCFICGATVKEKNKHFDHNHSFNKRDKKGWRGILCSRCNVGLGFFKDRVDLFTKAAEYLRNPPAQKLLNISA